jgi:hypothetical protein
LVAIAVATALVLLLISSYEHDQGAVEFTIALGADVARFAFVGIVIASTWLYLRTEAEHVQALDRCAVDAARMDEQTAEARLQLLEARSSRTSCSTRSPPSGDSTKSIARAARACSRT